MLEIMWRREQLKRDWQLYVTKDVFVGETEYTLTLYCSDGNTKRKR